MKWFSQFCRVGRMLQQWKEQEHFRYPRCSEENKTSIYIIQCKHDSATLQWRTSITELHPWMIKNNSFSSFAAVIINQLESWRDPTYQIIHSTNLTLTEIIIE